MENIENNPQANNLRGKRERLEDEISPTIRQDPKARKMAQFTPEQLQKLIDDVAKLVDMQPKIDTLVNDLRTIKDNQIATGKAIEDITANMVMMDKRINQIDERQVDMSGVKKELNELSKKNNLLEQAFLANKLMIKNLPSEIENDNEKIQQTLDGIFAALNTSMKREQYEFTAFKAKDKKSTIVEVTFETALGKKNILESFRKIKRNSNSALLVEKFIELPVNHRLNGVMIAISNKLTQMNAQLLREIRKYVPEKFSFALDTIDGNVIAKNINGKFQRFDHIDELKQFLDTAGNQNKEKVSKKNGATPSRETPIMTRRATGKSQGG